MVVKNTIFENVWNILVVIFAAFATIFVTLNIVFDFSHTTYYITLEWTITVIFLFDIVINILNRNIGRSAQFSEETHNTKSYLRTWFVLDLLAAIPFVFLFHLPILGIFRLFKLIKVASILHQFRRNAIHRAYTLVFAFFIFWTLLSAHLLSCGWLMLRGIDNSFDDVSNYVRSLYWTITTLTTVGYSDITPQNNSQIIYAIFIQILALGLIGYLIGRIVSILSKRNPAKAQYLENVEKLTALNHYRDLPPELLKRINNYYYLFMEKKAGI